MLKEFKGRKKVNCFIGNNGAKWSLQGLKKSLDIINNICKSRPYETSIETEIEISNAWSIFDWIAIRHMGGKMFCAFSGKQKNETRK